MLNSAYIATQLSGPAVHYKGTHYYNWAHSLLSRCMVISSSSWSSSRHRPRRRRHHHQQQQYHSIVRSNNKLVWVVPWTLDVMLTLYHLSKHSQYVFCWQSVRSLVALHTSSYVRYTFRPNFTGTRRCLLYMHTDH